MATNWDEGSTQRIGGVVRQLRTGRGWSAKALADRTTELGHSVGRATISELETGKRRNVSVAELVVLAAALDVPPVALLYPDLPDGEVEVLPGFDVSHIEAVQWFSGEAVLRQDSRDFDTDRRREAGVERVQASRRLNQLRHALAAAEWQLAITRPGGTIDRDGALTPVTQEHRDQAQREVDQLRGNIEQLTDKMRASGWTVDDA